jgi:hypothetical protein
MLWEAEKVAILQYFNSSHAGLQEENLLHREHLHFKCLVKFCLVYEKWKGKCQLILACTFLSLGYTFIHYSLPFSRGQNPIQLSSTTDIISLQSLLQQSEWVVHSVCWCFILDLISSMSPLVSSQQKSYLFHVCSSQVLIKLSFMLYDYSTCRSNWIEGLKQINSKIPASFLLLIQHALIKLLDIISRICLMLVVLGKHGMILCLEEMYSRVEKKEAICGLHYSRLHLPVTTNKIQIFFHTQMRMAHLSLQVLSFSFQCSRQTSVTNSSCRSAHFFAVGRRRTTQGRGNFPL